MPTKVMRIAKGLYNVEREENKKAKSDVIASCVMGNVFNPHVDHGRMYIRYECKEQLKHPTLQTVFGVGLDCFDYSRLLRCQEVKRQNVNPDCLKVSALVTGCRRS